MLLSNKITIAIFFGLCIASIGILNLTTNASYLAYFDKNDVLVKTYLAKQQTFEINDNLILVLKTKDSTPLYQNPNFYINSKQLINKLSGLASVNKVQDFLTELRWKNNIFSPSNNNKATPQKPFNFLSKNGNLAIISLDVKLEDNTNAKQILALNQSVLNLAKEEYKDFDLDFYLSGALGLNNAYIETVRHDIKSFIPLLILSMLAALITVLKNIKLSLALLMMGVLSTFAAFGIIGWLGLSLTSINIFTPIMIIGLSLVTNMHNTLAYYSYVALGENKTNALRLSFKENVKPLILSCLTTAIGFLFLLTSPSPPIIVTGLTAALGILISLTLSLTIFQRCLIYFAPSQQVACRLIHQKWLSQNLRLPLKYSKAILLLTLLSLPIVINGLSKLEINDNVYRYFPDAYDFRKSILALDNNFNGIGSIDYIFSTQTKPNETTSINKTDNPWGKGELNVIRKFTKEVATLPSITQVLPYRTLLSAANVNNFYHKEPTSKSPFHTYINKEKHQIRIHIRFNEMPAKQILLINEVIQEIARKAVGASNNQLIVSSGTSPDILFANISYNNAKSMFFSLTLALSLISIFTGWLLKSWRLAALVFICNFLPIVFAYGILGLLGAHLTLGSTVVIGMIIGIVVDDTLHLLFKYQHYLSKSRNALAAIRQHVFPPVIISSLIIILALSVGLASDFQPTFEISVFSIGVIFFALFTDVFLLPILLKLINKHNVKKIT